MTLVNNPFQNASTGSLLFQISFLLLLLLLTKVCPKHKCQVASLKRTLSWSFKPVWLCCQLFSRLGRMRNVFISYLWHLTYSKRRLYYDRRNIHGLQYRHWYAKYRQFWLRARLLFCNNLRLARITSKIDSTQIVARYIAGLNLNLRPYPSETGVIYFRTYLFCIA